MIIAIVVALLALPLVTLRRHTLLHCYGAMTLAGCAEWLVSRRVPIVDPRLTVIAIGTLGVAIVAAFVAAGRDVRWSANRAAVMAAIVYALATPAMLRHVPDGDEPYYLLITESIVHDRDFDLANQYRTLPSSEAQRTDLGPQPGDPVGDRGEKYSRHEPFLALLLVPGYALGGFHGAVATIALFAVLLVRSTVRWMEDEGIPDHAIRAVIPFFAFGPPILFYATRIWPEVPAAFFFVEAVRGARAQRMKRWLPALFGLVMLKLRFVLVAAMLVVTMFRRRPRTLLLGAAVVAVPLFVVWMITGSATNVHSLRELLPGAPQRYAIGFFGLLVDGMSGIAFQAPVYLIGLFALASPAGRKRDAIPRGFTLGLVASSLYIVILLPRVEWFGGWAPPLRYLVFLMPVLALGAAAVWDRTSRGAIVLAAAGTIALVIHGLAYPWRLFHIANGENAAGEWLSVLHQADFSRLFPSFVRLNHAAWIGAAAVVVLIAFGLRRHRVDLSIPLVSIALAGGFALAQQPGSRVEFEDAHVVHEGGDLSPELYTVMRVAWRCGWVLEAGDSVSFLAREGQSTIHAITGLGATFEIGGRAYHVEPSEVYQTIRVDLPRSGRTTLRCVSGAINLDRMDHD